MDIATLVTQLLDSGEVNLLLNDPSVQFGTSARPYVGASILPERTVEDNEYTDENIRYQTVIANDGSRYSPAQLKASGAIIGQMKVSLGNQDIARQFTGREYDVLLRLLNQDRSMEATTQLIRWVDTTILRALLDLNEKQRWDAIITAQVIRVGNNGFREVVPYPNPAGHRSTVGDAWDTVDGDPFADINAGIDLLTGKGYTANRIVTSRQTLQVMLNNANVRQRAGAARIEVTPGLSPQLNAAYGRASLQSVNAVLAEDGIPPIELYDLQYRDLSGAKWFLPRGKMVILATTGQDETIIANEEQLTLLENTIGYTAIGRAVGQPTPGRVIWMEPKTNKPPRVEAEGWMTSLPVINTPEGIVVLNGLHS
jgi:hypothetical protein